MIALIPMLRFVRQRKYSPSSLYRALLWIFAVIFSASMLLLNKLPEIQTGQIIPFSFALITGLLSYLFMMLLQICLAVLVITVHNIDRRRWSAQFPDAVIITELLNTLYQIEKESAHWTELDFKRALMRRLEFIAVHIQRDLPRHLRSGDSATDVWLEKTTQKMAAAMREKKKWILTPTPNTRESLMEHLKTDFTSAVLNNWDGFEKEEPEQLSRSQFVFRVKELLEAFIKGALPLLAFLIVQRTPFAIADPTADYAMLAALGWLLVTVLLTVDPSSRDTLDVLKKFRELLSP